ncbi:flap endonuclease-1 [Candidatus Micrarchaeota archaeon]|nr:flap endonuclease-1 [Candidatus Micrarchaeota archaeon]
MGVDIKSIVQPKEVSISDLSGKSLAFDAFNIIYQFLSSIRQPDGTPLMDENGNITSHLSGLFYRNINFLEAGIKPIYVFDGEPPEFKVATLEDRTKRKKEAELKYKEALEKGLLKEARKYSQQLSELTEDMIEESKKLLRAMGIPTVDAPSEGEAQAAWMSAKGLVYGVVSQDFDSLLFGAKRLIRNLSITGRRKLPGREVYVKIPVELIELEETLETLGITREKLIWIGVLVGTDYNKGVKGIGPKTALKLVRKYDSLDGLLEFVENKYGYVFPEDVQSIIEFFRKPKIKEDLPNIELRRPDEARIKELLCDVHNFSETRVENALEKMHRIYNERYLQKSIKDFFGT